jgi:hypothetical protein
MKTVVNKNENENENENIKQNKDEDENLQIPKKRGRKPKTIVDKEETEVKIPKKRGRKPKPKTESEEPKIPKKRGRKPKPKPENEEPKIPKKRGRRPKEKLYSIIPKNVQPVNLDNEKVILHLKINNNSGIYDVNKEEKNEILQYNPDITEPDSYDPNDINLHKDSYFEEIEEMPDYSNIIDNETHIKEENIFNILGSFRENNLKYGWPDKTDICCWWCCHKFTTSPIGLPYKKDDETYFVKGCFCSFNCAASYNFQQTEQTSYWDRYSLLNLLYKKMFKTKETISLAPPRELLTIFGGSLSIEKYREKCKQNNKEYRIYNPPMLSTLFQIEEQIIYKTDDKKKSFIPIDKTQISRANINLKLKRNKPLLNEKNTLENIMGLKTI